MVSDPGDSRPTDIGQDTGPGPRQTPGSTRSRRRRAVRRGLAAVAAIAAALLAYELLCGKLFPYCPVVVGFSRHELPHAVVYVQHGARSRDFAALDSLVPVVERSHGMRFRRKPRLFVFGDDGSYLRHSPSKARFCAFYDDTLVISPWALREADQSQLPLGIYIRHELSHLLLLQRMGMLSAHRFPQWLMEGVATYTADQMGTGFYPSRAETYELMRQGNFMPPRSFKTRAGDLLELRVKYRWPFVYCEFACLVEYLIETRGSATFDAYLTRLMAGGDADAVFRETYGTDLDAAVQEFRDHVQRPEPDHQRSQHTHG